MIKCTAEESTFGNIMDYNPERLGPILYYVIVESKILCEDSFTYTVWRIKTPKHSGLRYITYIFSILLSRHIKHINEYTNFPTLNKIKLGSNKCESFLLIFIPYI